MHVPLVEHRPSRARAQSPPFYPRNTAHLGNADPNALTLFNAVRCLRFNTGKNVNNAPNFCVKTQDFVILQKTLGKKDCKSLKDFDPRVGVKLLVLLFE